MDAGLFDEHIDFRGKVKFIESDDIDENHCQLTLNSVVTSRIKAKVFSESTFFEALECLSSEAEGKILIENLEGMKSYRVEGRSGGGSTSAGLRVLNVNVTNAYKHSLGDLREEDKPNKLYMDLYFPLFREGFQPFRHIAHQQRGLLFGWLGSGEWLDQEFMVKCGDLEMMVRPYLIFEDFNFDSIEGHAVIPRQQLQVVREAAHIPEELGKAVETFYATNEKLQPLFLAINFVAARRIRPNYQELRGYDYANGVSSKTAWYRKGVDRDSSSPFRDPNFNQHWELIRKMTKAIDGIRDGERRQTISKAIKRYVEAFEAPFLELKLVLLHSALDFVVNQEKYMEVEVAEDVPDPHGGSVPWGAAI